MNERNERGWRIPRKGTKSYQIYHLLLEGFTAREIVDLFQEDHRKTGIPVLITNIKYPEKHNERERKWRKKNPKKFKSIYQRSMSMRKDNGNRYSPYVRKLAKILGISHTEAVELERKELEKKSANDTSGNS